MVTQVQFNNQFLIIYYNFNRMTFKQEYLHRNGPFAFNFAEERVSVRAKIMQLVKKFHPNEWAIRGLQPFSYFQSYKQVYGITSQQITQIMMQFLQYLKEPELSCQGAIAVMKTLVGLKQYKIGSTQELKFDNKYFIQKLKNFGKFGIPYPLKNSDAFVENLIKVIKIYSKYGQQYFEELMQLAIQERDIKFLAIFIKSIKSQKTAQRALDYIFQQSSLFQRDTSFFYIIAQLTLEFPLLNLNKYHQTLSQQIIKTITTIVDPSTQQQLKKLTIQDPSIGVQCTIKSVARILINCLQPVTQSGWQRNWARIERIFSIIGGIIDHTHQVECINQFLIFIKEFVKIFQVKYRKQRGLYEEVNEDFVQQFHGTPQKIQIISEKYMEMFEQIMMPLVPELLYFQDGQVKAAKILSDLAMFQPKKYLAYILEEIKVYLQKDLTICSTYTSKMTLLFLQEFIILNYLQSHQFTLLIQCCELLLDALQKLGISQNLDILELVMRIYMYFPDNIIQELPILCNMTEDIITIIEQNMDPMSINLQSTQSEQAQLYTDFKNIYFNFIIRLNQKQIQAFSDKILYKISTNVPSHRQAYQFITVALSYKDRSLGKKILDIVFKNLVVSHRQKNNGKKSQLFDQVFPIHQQYSFLTKNQQHIRFYSSILQCAFQYNPENLVSQWKRIQIIITLMLRQVQNLSIFDWGMDVLFNVIINLEHIHLHPSQFFKNSNRKYQTINNVSWIHPSIQSIGLLQHIKKTFYDSITLHMLNRYEKILQESEKAQRLKSQKVIQVIFDRSQTALGPKPIQVKEFINQFLDCLLVPSTPSSEDIEQKKYINKLLSIQYAVFSALQIRAQFTAKQDMFEISSVFIKELGSIRKHAIQHLKWILQLLAHYNCLYDPSILKLFHFFWRQAHDQLYFSAGIEATNEKLHPFFYPVSYKKKELFENSFLIMTESYVTFMMRIELFSMLQPMAHINNPQFLQYTVPLTFSSTLDCSLKSYIPLNVDPHINYHFQILNICRLKLCLYNSNSYIRKSIIYSKSGNEGTNKIERQKYIGAIRVIISNYKRNLNIFIYPCCMRDQTCWYSLQQILQISQYLQKKNDKVGIIEIIYLLVVFSFDFKGVHIYKSSVPSIEKNIAMLDHDDQIMQMKIINYLRFVIEKINGEIIKKFYEKDATVLVLLLICFSQFIPIHHEIFKEIIPLIINIMLKNTEEMMNIGKTFLFRILNRFIKLKTQIVQIENIPIKRSYSDFITYRHLGGKTAENTDQPAYNLITNKNQNYYYPVSHLQYLHRQPLNPNIPNEQILLKNICDEQIVRLIFKSLLSDTQLKAQESQVDVSYLSEEQPKRIYSNGHKLINYILDSNPKKLNIFLSFIDNFSNYPICFYHRFFRKMMINGGTETVKIMQKIVKEHIRSTQIQQVKLSQFLLSQILPFCPQDEEFYNFYTNFLVTCSKEQFQFANGCLLVTFCIDWRISRIIFNNIISKLREQKGSSRLRHLQVFNNYLLCTGRFSQEQAKNGILYLMKGIEQGTDEVSELIVSMLIYCFIIPINLKLLQKWLKQSDLQLAQKSKIYQLDYNTGYQINSEVRLIIQEIVNKTKQQTDLQSKNLKVYSKIAYKILSNIFVHRFNDQFYNLFKKTMLYIVNKPLEEGGYDQQIVSQLKDSEYPQHIYEDLIKELKNMEGNTINVQKKKLRYIQSVVINKIFSNNKVQIPDIFTTINEKSIAIDHIIAVSNMARIMKGEELTAQVEKILNSQQSSTKNLNFLMAYLLAAGTRDFEWREKVLNQILSFKKYKVVKQFVSYWWKGRNPQTEKQQRLCMLVRSVENPYSYFA